MPEKDWGKNWCHPCWADDGAICENEYCPHETIEGVYNPFSDPCDCDGAKVCGKPAVLACDHGNFCLCCARLCTCLQAEANAVFVGAGIPTMLEEIDPETAERIERMSEALNGPILSTRDPDKTN